MTSEKYTKGLEKLGLRASGPHWTSIDRSRRWWRCSCGYETVGDDQLKFHVFCKVYDLRQDPAFAWRVLEKIWLTTSSVAPDLCWIDTFVWNEFDGTLADALYAAVESLGGEN